MMKWYENIFIALVGVGCLAGNLLAVGPTPELKEQMKSRGLYKNYIQKQAVQHKRGIDIPAPHAPDLSEARNNPGLYKTLTTTYLNALVILVDFSDNIADTLNHTPADFQDLLFSEASYPTGSMNDWYLENSYGEVGISGTVTRWVRLPQTYAYYANNDNGFGNYPMNAQKMAEDAVAAVDSTVDFSLFDNDGDGYVDALFIVHAGPGAEATGNDADIWSHSWSMQNTQVRDGVTLSGYTTEPEVYGNHITTMGVFGHEFGHALGLPDLYDTDYSSDGVGFWSMMSGGSWGSGGTKPVHFDAWSKIQLNWIDPIVLSDDTTNVLFEPVENSPKVMRLWTAGMPGSEYFLVENRQRLGFDISLPGEGLLIWHIDNTVGSNADEWHKKVALVQADGNLDLENGRGSDSGDPFPGDSLRLNFSDSTTPNSNDYFGNPTQVSVTDITPQGNDILFNAGVNFQSPYLVSTGWNILDGGQNNALNSGEIDTLQFSLQNLGVEMQNVTTRLTSSTPEITILQDSVFLNAIGHNESVSLDTSFVVSVDSSASEWAVSTFSLTLSNDSGTEFQFPFSAFINQGFGYFSNIETDSALWSHYNISQNFRDGWEMSEYRNHSQAGMKSWKLGSPGSGDYENSTDAALQTPRIFLKDSSEYELTFWHWMDAEVSSDDPSYAWDGGRIEISDDEGTTWEVLTPEGGYPYLIVQNPDSPFEPNTPVFSGNHDWQQVTVPLDDYHGEILVRFHFGSDAHVTGEGWYIDDVNIQETNAPVAVQDNESTLPLTTQLLPNYPNPFNPNTTIPIELAQSSRVQISIYNLKGQRVSVLLNEIRAAGHYSLQWDGTDSRGEMVSSGVYFVQLRTSNKTMIRKMTLLR